VRTADLAREILLDGMIEGMNRARPMAELSRVVMQVVLGIFAGPAVSAAGIIIELTLLCGAYRAEIEELYRTGPRVSRGAAKLSRGVSGHLGRARPQRSSSTRWGSRGTRSRRP
jgi:hypothetical protein